MLRPGKLRADRRSSDEAVRAGPDGTAAVTLANPEDDADEAGAMKVITIAPRVQVEIQVPSVRRLPPEPILDFEIAKTPSVQVVSGIDIVSLDRFAADDDLLRYNVTTVVRNATLRIIAGLPYLSPAVHHQQVERLVHNLLVRLGAKEDSNIALDPVKVAILVSDEIDRRYIKQPVRFELLGDAKRITPSNFEWRVREEVEAPIPKASITDWQ